MIACHKTAVPHEYWKAPDWPDQCRQVTSAIMAGPAARSVPEISMEILARAIEIVLKDIKLSSGLEATRSSPWEPAYSTPVSTRLSNFRITRPHKTFSNSTRKWH